MLDHMKEAREMFEKRLAQDTPAHHHHPSPVAEGTLASRADQASNCQQNSKLCEAFVSYYGKLYAY